MPLRRTNDPQRRIAILLRFTGRTRKDSGNVRSLDTLDNSPVMTRVHCKPCIAACRSEYTIAVACGTLIRKVVTASSTLSYCRIITIWR
ncbi:hypothetical protein Cob_v005163 [Colletotrichum orbiculare MAFF 240422]|uniref:Uncharacterized protein n=1 Tax=Colletotrichum orbiculare (strain 104-T / ATCC 96160 / CBS 514.97 / LARS 414 / MAFF 240422) TaxID=1213857 RepID=A0A484FVJ2_COLOR|nr:hypothetical protein Cob_v005163 [Colletotrichum orbiculare MAFF 240422]